MSGSRQRAKGNIEKGRQPSQSVAHSWLLLGVLCLPFPIFNVSLLIFNSSAFAQTTQDRKAESIRLNNEGEQLRQRGQFRAALEKYQQALAIVKAISEREVEGVILNNIGLVYDSLGQNSKALKLYQQALAIRKEVGDRSGEGITLNSIGVVYNALGQYPKALKLYQQALAIRKEVSDRSGEGITLNNIGLVYNNLGQYPKALEFYQQALAIRKEVSDRSGEGTTLNNVGAVYNNLGQYPKALEFFQQALTIDKELGNRSSESTTLNNIGQVYNNLGQYPKALEFYQQSLAIQKEIGGRPGEGATLNNIGQVYNNLGQYPKALEFYQQALTIYKEVGNRSGEGTTLNNIGAVYNNLGQYPKALEFYQQALAIQKEIGDRFGESAILNNIGLVYNNLGQYPKALEFYQQALTIYKEVGSRLGESTTLNNIGAVYDSLGQYPIALEFYQQALAICREVGDRSNEGTTLNNVGAVYLNLGRYPKALEFFQQALVIHKEVGSRLGESTTLNNIGAIYNNLGQYPKSLESYQQALAIQKDIGDRSGEGKSLNNIGYLLETQKQLELAVVFLKQSVSTYEAIREELQVLPKEQQESYTKTVADTYRGLADILLQQDRVLEAQQVLDLLKVQELNDYLRNVRGGGQALIVLRPEAEILQRYGELQKSAIQVGSELAQLRQAASQRTLTAAEEKRLETLDKLQDALNEQFNQFTQTAEILTLVAQLQRSQEPVKLEQFDDLRRNLAQLGNAVLLYPLILDDRIELILTLPNTAPLRRTVYVKRAELNQTILEFRQALQNPKRDAKVPAQKLYTWLIQPLEADLKQVNAQTIIYAPDGQLRYIPLAALYDGKQWLVQRFRTNNITASSLTKFGTHAQPQLRILAGAFANSALTYSVPSGDRSLSFVGLPFAGKEVETLQAAIPNTVKYIDAAFSLQTFKPRMNGFSVVHLATHAAFVPGAPEDSFILFGDGKIANLQDIGKWDLENVDLVVLSACETGVGIQAMGAKALGDGKEVLGLGYQFQNRGARATIASLWQVDDGGTQVLMTAFYQALQKGMTKAEALRQAQIALITSQDKETGNSQRASLRLSPQSRDALAQRVNDQLSHPYYWAPFILIGNGL
jgi:CHAT domain-containing protein/tetratricopeptide (TPR) repeat protein